MAETEVDVFQIVHAPNGWPIYCILTNDEVIPVTNWHDEDGDDVTDADDVYPAFIVAGPCSAGNWFTVDMSEFTDIVARLN